MKGDVKLKHCVVKDIIHEVSDFAHLSPKQRPESFCPECDSQLILKLSNSTSPKSKVHHAAHKNENLSCSLSSPEGVLHFNTKWYIYEQLTKGNKFFIKQICSGWSLSGDKWQCSRWQKSSCPYLWLENWDDVKIERNVQSLRPDIVLYRNDNPIAAIEVCVTHEIDDEKKTKLREINLPWIEVKADGEIIDEYFVNWVEEYEDDEFPWKIEKPLIYDNCYPLPEEWVCDSCKTAPEEYVERLKNRDEQEALREAQAQSDRLKKISDEREKVRKQIRYTQDHDNHIIKAKAIVLLKPFGATELLELFVIERHNPEPPYTLEEIYLKAGRIGGQILISEDPITEHSKRNIFEFYKNWMKAKEKPMQKVYHLTDWIDKTKFENLVNNYSIPFEWKRLQGWIKKL